MPDTVTLDEMRAANPGSFMAIGMNYVDANGVPNGLRHVLIRSGPDAGTREMVSADQVEIRALAPGAGVHVYEIVNKFYAVYRHTESEDGRKETWECRWAPR